MNQLVQGFAGDRGLPVLADIEETEDAYIVDLDLPGVQPGDVDIELEGTALRVTGEYKERERTGVLRRTERPIGRFEHLITLPDGIDPDKVEARLADGVLSIKVLKAPTNRPRRIEVKPQDDS
jgi:HSP20 family protein